MDLLVGFVLPMALVFGLMYLMLIRPQKKKEKKMREMLNSLQVGWGVTTIGGVIGKIVNIKDNEITIETGVEKTKILFTRDAIKDIRKPVEG